MPGPQGKATGSGTDSSSDDTRPQPCRRELPVMVRVFSALPSVQPSSHRVPFSTETAASVNDKLNF